MKHAKVLIVLGWLPALVMVAAVNPALLGLVLSKVKTFLREHLTANGPLKVFVGYEAVAIKV
jgi:hypothetical protein